MNQYFNLVFGGLVMNRLNTWAYDIYAVVVGYTYRDYWFIAGVWVLHNHSHIYVNPLVRSVDGAHPNERNWLESIDILNKSTDLVGLYILFICRPLIFSMDSHILLILALQLELTLNI